MQKTETNLPSYEEMIKAGMHFGRKKSIFNPRMKPYVYLMRDNIYIIDLIKTTQGIVAAVDFLKKAIAENKLVLFVGLSGQSADLIQDLAEGLKMPYVTNRWIGGTFTNFKTVIGRVNYLETLEKELAAGEMAKYTKKERLLKEKELAKLRQKFNGLRRLTRVPDVLFVSSVKDSELAIREAKAAKIKVVGLVNTESDPTLADYPIPANDNARRSLELIINTIKNHLKNTANSLEAIDDSKR